MQPSYNVGNDIQTDAAVRNNETMGSQENWFQALDQAASEAGVDVQLCMMNPAHALASHIRIV